MSAERERGRLIGRAVGPISQARSRLRVPLVHKGFPYTAALVPRGVEALPAVKRTGSAFPTEWARSDPARVVRAAIMEGPMRLGVQALARPEVRGLDRLADLRRASDTRPVIFAANHHSHLDTPVLLTSLPDPWRHHAVVAAAADYFFGTRLTGAMSALVLNAIPIERLRVNRRSAELADDLIVEGWSLVIFPEGGRSPDGWGQPFRAGAAFLALRNDVAVVPVHIEGTGAILGKGTGRPRRGRSIITFGRPLVAEPGEDARKLGVRIEQAVAALGDESRTDWWSARQRAASGATPELVGPAPASWRRQWALGDRKQGLGRRPPRPSWPDLD